MIVLTDGLPMTEADGVTGRNNGHDLRKGLVSTLLSPGTAADPLSIRQGVFPKDWDQSGCKSLRVDPQLTPGQSVLIQPGVFACERSGQGPYIGWLETSAGMTFPLTSSNGTNPRWDVIYATVLDKASIATDAQSDCVIDVVQGTPSATPVVPTVSVDGAVLLAKVYRAAGSSGNTIAQANITGLRKSAGLLGGNRVMLEGDNLSDPGKAPFEIRSRAATASLPALQDFWDADAQAWRGNRGFKLTGTFPGTPNGASIVSGTIPTSGSTLISVTVPDPGWPFTITANATAQQITNTSCNWLIRTAGGSFVSTIINNATGLAQMTPNESTVFNGGQTVVLVAAPLSGVAVAWQADVRNKMTLRIDPA